MKIITKQYLKHYLKHLDHNLIKDEDFSEDYVCQNCNVRVSLTSYNGCYNIVVNFNKHNSGYYNNDNADLTCAEWQIKNLLE